MRANQIARISSNFIMKVLNVSFINKAANIYNSTSIIGLGTMDKIMHIFPKINHPLTTNHTLE